MKPRNMPGRKAARRERAAERADDTFDAIRIGRGARADAHPTISDMRFKIGRANRDAHGNPTQEIKR